uniref:Uncharacterized protein n=1 Tax=Acrobeloides nanus TaxID=290746 RepID=A0A914EAR2_9BILA
MIYTYLMLLSLAIVFVTAEVNTNAQFLTDQLENSHIFRVLNKRPFDRSVVLNRGIGGDMIATANDETIRPTSRFARKNCFFSPVQCSIYYKRSDPNFPHI